MPTFNRKFSEEDFVFSEVTVLNEEKNIIVRGTVENLSNYSWGSLTIEAEFFDSHGKFINEISEYLRGGLRSESKENFIIKNNCEDLPIKDYEKYTLRVVDASSF